MNNVQRLVDSLKNSDATKSSDPLRYEHLASATPQHLSGHLVGGRDLAHYGRIPEPEHMRGCGRGNDTGVVHGRAARTQGCVGSLRAPRRARGGLLLLRDDV